MADFSWDDYIGRRMQRDAGVTGGSSAPGFDWSATPTTRWELGELKAASREKSATLAEIRYIKEQELEANRRSLVGQLDLDPQGIPGRIVNAGASVAEGVANVVGAIASAPATLYGMALDANVPDEVKRAYARVNGNSKQPGPNDRYDIVPNPFVDPEKSGADRKLLDLPSGDIKERERSRYAQIALDKARKDGSLETNQQRVEKTKDAFATAAKIRNLFDVSSIVQRDAQRNLVEDLRDSYSTNSSQTADGWKDLKQGKVLSGAANVASGIAGLLANIGVAAVQNPQAAVELVSSNIPQIAAAAFGGVPGLLLTNVPYAISEFGKGITEYQAKNNGNLPSDTQMYEMAAWAASLALAETVGDKLTIGGLSKGARAAADVADATADGARKGFKEALKSAETALTKVPGSGVAGAFVKGASGEFLTEGYQTFAENKIQGKETSLEDAYVGGAMGAISGGTLATALQAPRSLASGVVKKAEEEKQRQSNDAEIQAAAQTGDVTPYLDPQSPKYSPETAISVLRANSLLETTTPEVRQANYEKAAQILADLEEQKSSIQSTIENGTPQGAQRALDEARANLATADPADSARVQLLTDIVSGLEENLNEVKSGKTDNVRLERQVAKLDEQIRLAQGTLSDFNKTISVPSVDTVDADIQSVSTAVDLTNTEAVSTSRAAAQRLINLSMATPELLTADKAMALANSSDSTLTPVEKAYFRAFSEARIRANALRSDAGVENEILVGSKQNLGIAQYRDQISALMAANKQDQVDKKLGMLMKFMKDHQAKADLTKQAFEEYKTTGQPVAVRSNGQGGWFIDRNADAVKADLRKEGGLVIGASAGKLVSRIANEAKAISAAATELQTAYEVKFNTKSPTLQGVANVSNVPLNPTAQVEQKSSTAESSQASQTKNSATSQDSGTTQSAGSQSVEAKSEVKTEDQSKSAKTVEEAPASSAKTEENAATENTQSTDQDQNQSTEETAATEANVPETVATEDLAETVDQEDIVDEPTDAADAAEPGTLSIFQQQSSEGTEFKLRNLVADFFTQREGSDSDVTKRPLVMVKDFLSNSTSRILEFVNVDILSAKQQQALNTFRQKAKEWDETIRKNLSWKKSRQFRYDDMMQFLQSGTEGALDLDENIKTAMSYAAFSWVAEAASRSMFNTDEEINGILNRDDEHPVTNTERAALSLVGTRQNLVVNTLGQRAIQALGLKAKKNAPKDLMPKLESALGAHIFKLLMDQGILKRDIIKGSQMAALTGNPDTNPNVKFEFVKLARTETGVLTDQAQEIVNAIKGTQSFLDKLFSVEPGLKEPSLEPIPFNQSKAKNTNQNVPKRLAKILAEKNAEANYVRQDMWQLLTQLDDDVALDMAGMEQVTETGTHSVNRLSIEAKNDGLVREYQRFKEWVGDFLQNTKDGLDSPIYFEHSVWKQQRVGIATNAINPQTSKIHRFLLFRKAWETKVDMNNAQQMDNFRLRVLEGLGVKTDKQSNAKSLASYDSKVGAPEIQAAVEVLRKGVFEGGMTRADQDVLKAGVKAGGEKFHSLDALMALAHQKQAEMNGKTEFTVQMMGEVDGVTNGPMLSHLMMGAAATAQDLFRMLNRGGFFEMGNAQSQYNLWREVAGHLDLYESTIRNVMDRVKVMANEKKNVALALDAVYAFTGKLEDSTTGNILKDGRNIIKTPLTAMVFGSSIKSAIDNMANNFVESIYGKFEDVAAGKMDINWALFNVNTLLQLGRQPSLPNMTTEQLLNYEFNDKQIEAIKKVFKSTLGKAVESTMKQDFAVFMEQRLAFNLAAETAFTLYDAAYEVLRKQFIQELISKGELATDSKGTPIHDLTAAQESELRQRLKALTPMMHTPMSKDSGSLASGMSMAKSKRKLSARRTYQSEIGFGNPFADTKVWSNKQKAFVEQRSVEANAFENIESAPGVAMAVLSAHSTDSAISHYAAEGNEVLNVHDAHGSGLSTFEQTARNLNAATWNAMLNYSPAREMVAALSRTLNGLDRLLNSPEASPELAKAVQSALYKLAAKHEMLPDGLIEAIFRAAKNTAFHADSVKLQALSQMQSIDQYALEGGNYEVTDADRAKASQMLAQLSSDLSPSEVKMLESLETALGALASNPVVEANPDAEFDQSIDSAKDVLEIPAVQAMQLLEDIGTPEAQQVLDLMQGDRMSLRAAVLKLFKTLDAAKMVQTLSQKYRSIPKSLWGQEGQPTIQSDADLVAFFEANPTATAKQVIELLAQQGRLNAINRKILSLVARVVSPDLMIRYVTPATSESMVMEAPATKSRGWYVASTTGEAIYVTSPAYVHSGLTAEVLLHELIHAAVAKTIDNPSRDAKQLVDELEALRLQAKTYAEQNNLTQYANALANVQEFVAWGMSNLAFQRDVLNKIQYQSKTGGNKLVSGMKKFIDTMAALVFKRPDQNLNNGLSVLIGNVSGLFYEAAQVKADPKSRLNLSMATANAIDSYTTLDVYQALASNTGSLSPSFDAHLKETLTTIVERLHGPFGAFAAAMKKAAAATPLDAWTNTLQSGQATVTASVAGSGLSFSQQELFAMEQIHATVKAALGSNQPQTRSAYRELYKLYTEMEKRLKPSDFPSQAHYDFFFKLESGADNRSDYLARFAAFGLGNEQFNKILQVATEITPRATGSMTITERLQKIFEKIVNFFSEKITHTYQGQDADAKLLTLVDQLVTIEAKRKAELIANQNRTNFLEPMEEGAKRFVEGAKNKVVDIASSNFVRNNTFTLVRLTGTAARTIAGNRVDLFLNGLQIYHDKYVKNRSSLIMSLVKEVTGHIEGFQKVLRSTKELERVRKQIISQQAEFSRKSFANEGENLTQRAKESITAVFLRTGMHNLMQNYTLAQMENLLDNPTAVTAEIARVEAKLPTAMKKLYIKQANVLGHHLATGDVKGFLMTNAHVIARMMGTPYARQITEAEAQAVEGTLKELITLYALKYTNFDDQQTAKQIFREENNRTDGNGVQYVLGVHQVMEANSLDRVFKNNPTQMMHGYTPDIVNPHVTLEIATLADGQALLDQGYEMVSPLSVDPADPTQEQRFMYVLRGVGMTPRVSGAMLFQTLASRGTKQHNGYMNANTVTGLDNAAYQASLTNVKMLELRDNAPPGRDLNMVRGSRLAPVYNEDGEIVNWRYLMKHSTKDDAAILQRDNSFDRIIGVLGGSVFDKSTTNEQNRTVIEALYAQYQRDFTTRREGYVEISETSSDPELREIWKLLSYQAKKDVRDIWKRDSMWVRADSLDLIFGYRKLTMATWFDKARKERDSTGRTLFQLQSINAMQQLTVGVVEAVLRNYASYKFGYTPDQAERYAKRAATVVTKGERMWQELVRETKDIIVVKTGVVLLGNIFSNKSMLLLAGLSPLDIAKYSLTALKGATAYQRDEKRLAQLQTLVDLGYPQGNQIEIDREMIRLKDAITRNPVRELIEAGLMPTIVEDVANDDDPYSYKSILARKTEKFTKQMNPSIVNAGKTIYMTHDTALYQSLSRMTQLSDFVARYALYQHLTTRQKNPLNKEAAIQKASDYFVNYDIPMHRVLQYTDDMGLTMFTKYFLRIQKPLLDLAQDNPLRVLLAVALNSIHDLGPIVLDSSFVHHIGNNPIRTGALQFPGTLDQLATVKAAMGLIK